MCGIFGVINTKEKIDEGRVLAARDILAHRGPDDAGIYLAPNNERSLSRLHRDRDDNTKPPFVALTHRRLSIIDLSPAAHQPMIAEIERLKDYKIEGIGNEDSKSFEQSAESSVSPEGAGSIQNLPKGQAESRYVIVFNGEIYNFRDLLCHSGLDPESMHSNSDTEIILRLFAKEGNDCLNMLRGMFAFAIWDDREKTLFAARDRFGIKPFYYLKNDDEFIFSSELKAIKHYKKDLTISKEGIDAFLRTGSVPAPLTIYNEVASLLPGQYLIMHNAQCTMYNYWNFNNLFKNAAGQNAQSSMFSVKSAMNKIPTTSKMSIEHSKLNIKNSKLVYDSEAKKKIRIALLDSVRAHMVSDVEVGAFLSGGIDSTAIVSLMRQVGQEKIKTVSVVFPGNKLDESKYSRLAAKYYKTEHIEIPFYEKDLIDDFEKIMASMDQPTIDGINTYFVSKAAKQAGLKVVLSGLGGDELFGGYPSFINIPKYQRIKNLPFAKMFMKAAAPLLKNKLPAKAIEYMKNPDAENAEYKMIRGLFTDDELQQLGWTSHPDYVTLSGVEGSPTVISAEGIPLEDDFVRRNLKDFSGEDSFEMTNMQYISFLETTFYMRNQLLRDSDVFSMAHSLELRVPFVDHLLYKTVLPYIDDAFDKNYPKKMLVDAVGDIPLELINRPKMGFTFPFAEWISKGQLKNLIIQKLKDLDLSLGIEHSSLNIDRAHWSRMWALFVISNYTK